MDNFNWFILEIIAEQRLREVPRRADPVRAPRDAPEWWRLRTRLAAWLVRVGLRLDPGLAERVRPPARPPVTPEARQHA